MNIYLAFALNRGIVCFNIVLGEGGAGGCGFSLWVFIYLTPVYGLSPTKTVLDAQTLAKGEHDECMLPHLFCQHRSHYLESRHNGCEAVGREATPRHNQNSFCASELTKGTVRGVHVFHNVCQHLPRKTLLFHASSMHALPEVVKCLKTIGFLGRRWQTLWKMCTPPTHFPGRRESVLKNEKLLIF